MKQLKDTKFAAGVLVAVLILSLFGGTHKSLAATSSRIEDQFYTGVLHKTDGYTMTSIHSQINAGMDLALGLVAIARNYPELADKADTLAKCREELFSADDINEFNRLTISLQEAFESLYSSAVGVEMSERDRNAAAAYATDFESMLRYLAALAESYNETVTDYWRVSHAFPANVFGRFTDAPKYYSFTYVRR